MSIASGGPLLGLLALATLEPFLQSGLLDTQMGQLLVVLVGIAVVILVGRLVLRIAWRLVTIAAVVVGIALILSMLGLL
ncbi:MAG: hypothetical protein V5A46_10470 [Haloferacaceae archaeon]